MSDKEFDARMRQREANDKRKVKAILKNKKLSKKAKQKKLKDYVGKRQSSMMDLLDNFGIDPDDKRANPKAAAVVNMIKANDIYTVVDKSSGGASKFFSGKAYISVSNAFPKILKLNQQTEAKPLELHALRNTTEYTSIELQLNKQGNSIYYWTFSLGSSDGTGGKASNAYLRDTPGVFNSLNTEQDIKNENVAEKRKISTSKVNKKQREEDKKLMARKKVDEDQSLVILLYNEKVIGTFLGNFV